MEQKNKITVNKSQLTNARANQAHRKKSESFFGCLQFIVILAVLGGGFYWAEQRYDLIDQLQQLGSRKVIQDDEVVASDHSHLEEEFLPVRASRSKEGASTKKVTPSVPITFEGDGQEKPAADSGMDTRLPGLNMPAEQAMTVYASDLTPAFCIHSTNDSVRLFDSLASFGLSTPTRISFVKDGDVQVMSRGKVEGSPDESWLLVWFTGGTGWDNLKYTDYVTRHIKDDGTYAFDVPFLISLQHRPLNVELNEESLKIQFAEAAGAIQLLPLYGVDRLDPAETLTWSEQLPEEVLADVRHWNALLKYYPAGISEHYTVNAEEDYVEITYQTELIALPDEWGTEPRTFSPVAPAVAVSREAGMPLQFSHQPEDMGTPSQFGPYWVVPDQQSFALRLQGIPGLIVDVPYPDVNRDEDTVLLGKIEEHALSGLGDAGIGWFAAAGASVAQARKTKAIPYVSDETAEKIKSTTLQYLHAYVFNEDYIDRLYDEKYDRTRIVDRYNNRMRYAGDNEPIALQIARGLFTYAFYTGDWYTLQGQWENILQMGVNSYHKNSWLIHSRFNTGGDSYHDLLTGTASIARMAAALGKENEFGFYTYLLTRHLIGYFAYEYALEQHARSYQPWFSALDDSTVVVWDIYQPFGAFFAPFDAEGFYGAYTGFFEHYYRLGEPPYSISDIMPRYYHMFLKTHVEQFFGNTVQSQVPPPESKEGSKWSLLFFIQDALLDTSYEELDQWLGNSGWRSKRGMEASMALYDKKHLRVTKRILHPDISAQVSGSGLHDKTDSAGRNIFNIDRFTQREPAPFWFGFAPRSRARDKTFHGGNGMHFGLIKTAEGKIVNRVDRQPNWVTTQYGHDVLIATEEEREAAERQGSANWAIIGPIGEKDKDSETWAQSYFPEAMRGIQWQRKYDGPTAVKNVDGVAAGEPLELQWQEVQTENFRIPCRWGFNHFGSSYLYTRVQSPRPQKVKIGFTARSWRRIWINGSLVAEEKNRDGRAGSFHSDDPSGVNPDSDYYEANLERGWNDILIRIRNTEFYEWVYFRIYDQDERTIPGLNFNPRGH